jgi:hypothetical protein
MNGARAERAQRAVAAAVVDVGVRDQHVVESRATAEPSTAR